MSSQAPASAPPFRLGLVLFPGCMAAGLFATADLVRACNLRDGRERVRVTWVGVERGNVATHLGPTLRAESTFAESELDACLLPGLWLTSTDALDGAVHAQRQLVDAVRGQPRGTEVWSYCAGVALAAAAGRLDSQAATATWWLQPALAGRFPRVRWSGELDLVTGRHGATAAGPSGYLPLMLDRLARHFPAAVLEDVQELLMLPLPRRRHAAFQGVEMMILGDPAMRTLLRWAQRTPAQDLTLAMAAQHSRTSVRTLCRQVERATGMAAGNRLRRVKLAQVAEAPASTRAPIKAISERLGFGGEASLYRTFRAATGLTPAAYRLAYGSRAPVSSHGIEP